MAYILAHGGFPVTGRKIFLGAFQVCKCRYPELPYLVVIGVSDFISIGNIMNIQLVYHIALPAAKENITKQYLFNGNVVTGRERHGIRTACFCG